jgi:hypothetical protein
MKYFLRMLACLTLIYSTSSIAAVTNLAFVGGCPSVEDDAQCFNAGNANTTNVALILGVAESSVSQINGSQESDGNNGDFTVNGIGSNTGTWSVSNTDITHLAIKADGYFILAEVQGNSGDWSSDVLEFLTETELANFNCPVGICNPDARPYELADFRNSGGQVAALSNMRAFSVVVPVPAAAWLFGSALLGLAGLKRKQS